MGWVEILDYKAEGKTKKGNVESNNQEFLLALLALLNLLVVFAGYPVVSKR